MKPLYLLLILFFPILIQSQTITSVSTGGNWDNGNTWIGGVVPSGNNDVVINGTVIINVYSATVKSLTVNSGAILQNNENGYPDLYVTNGLINNGTIRDNPGVNGYIDLYAAGSVVNNGTISNEYLTFNGNSGTQTMGGSSAYSVREIAVVPD
ncbi:MAG: hypothetical protein JW995_09620, partial [Melioribacteraceae bacterium]|nr:hypothetical protein [Melioribacteraceae bacterium]